LINSKTANSNYLIAYKRLGDDARRFISSCLVQLLIEQHRLNSCYELSKKFDAFTGIESSQNSKYWYKIKKGAVISSDYKIRTIEKFDSNACKLFSHPLFQLVNLPSQKFTQSPILLLINKRARKLASASSYVDVLESQMEKTEASIYLRTLNNLYFFLTNCFDASAAFHFEKVKFIQMVIDKEFELAEKNWRYPKTVCQLKTIIEKKLFAINNANLKFSRKLH